MTISVTSKNLEAESSGGRSMMKKYTIKKKKGPTRPRSWKPLKYPRSSFLLDGLEKENAMPYFPFQRDVLLATVRELLIIEKRLHYLTFEVLPQERANEWKAFEASGKQVDGLMVLTESTRKRKQQQTSTQDFSSAEEIADVIVNNILRRTVTRESETTEGSCAGGSKRPRKVSEADQIFLQVAGDGKAPQEREIEQLRSVEISSCFNLTRQGANGGFPRIPGISPLPPMLHASISDESFLRASAVQMTQRLMGNFQESSLRLFLGYKAPLVAPEKICHLLANIIFDVSHAMFAWVETEREIITAQPSLEDPDTAIRNMLFCDKRSLANIGGFMPYSLLPQAISICRLRRRGLSWANFAKTAPGKRMFEHHGKAKRLIAVGKERRGQRLRQQYLLTLAMSGPGTDECSRSNVSRPRSCSITSNLDNHENKRDEMEKPTAVLDHTVRRTFAELSGSKRIVLSRSSTEDSWGVSLVQEGDACVVGKVQSGVNNVSSCPLQCGDVILCVQGEYGAEAASPISSVMTSMPSTDWFQQIVDIFRNSAELVLAVKRA